MREIVYQRIDCDVEATAEIAAAEAVDAAGALREEGALAAATREIGRANQALWECIGRHNARVE
jgi:hypothetical protein